WLGASSAMHNDCIIHFNMFSAVVQGKKGTTAGLRSRCVLRSDQVPFSSGDAFSVHSAIWFQLQLGSISKTVLA
ncbi:hypothetical protein A2U01_0008609, partial [Trifolium medium]|nr:hypothetical protein [Trifolium medium]